VKNPDYQAHVATLMKGDLTKPDAARPRFFFHLGDVVYFNGQISEYYGQFYEPYDHYDIPIFAIPGNHDGDPIDSSQTSLDGFVEYFMTPAPRINPESKDAARATMQQPNVYFTLNYPFVTIVGMYTNVPEHGSIDSVQQQWLTHEFATAPADKALILALHHPIYSFDDHHSGSTAMADAVQQAINDSRRVPNMVLTGHVHNYQRIERSIVKTPTPFMVIGHGGYFHLHGINADKDVEDPNTHAKLVEFNKTNHGYATLSVDAENISGTMTTIDETKYKGAAEADTFTYPAKAVYLPAGAVVSL
jgi:DNA repair exonuclease SbcCD nuclease subunit